MGLLDFLFKRPQPQNQLVVLNEQNQRLTALLHIEKESNKQLQNQIVGLQERLFGYIEGTFKTPTGGNPQGTRVTPSNATLSPRQKDVKAALGAGSLSAGQVAKKIGVKSREQASVHLSKMVKSGAVERIGSGKFVRYQLVK